MQTQRSILSLYDVIAARGGGAEALSILGLTEGQKIWLVSLLVQACLQQQMAQRGRLVIVHTEPKFLQQLDSLIRSNCKLADELLSLQSQQFWGLHRFVNQSDILSDRLRVMTSLVSNAGKPTVVLASFAGLLQKTASSQAFKMGLLRLERGHEYDIDRLLEQLEERAYRAVDQVEEPGQYAVKGGLLDVFSPAQAQPFRCEFLADTLLTLRSFAPETQLSQHELEAVWIVSMWELTFPRAERPLATQKLYEALLEQPIAGADRQGIVDAFAAGYPVVEMPLLLPALRPAPESCLLDYLDDADTLLFLDPSRVCLERYQTYLDKLRIDAKEDAAAQRPGLPPEQHFFTAEEALAKLQQPLLRVECGEIFGDDHEQTQRVQSQPPASWKLSLMATPEAAGLNFWMQKLQELDQGAQRVLILIRQEEHVLRIKSLLQHHGLSFRMWEEPATQAPQAALGTSIWVGVGALPQLLWEEREGLLVLPEHILFGENFQPERRNKRSAAAAFRSFQDLDVGALVVHVDHGIGRYMGMRTMEMSGIRTDFLVLEYADQDRLYLPVHRLNLLQRYSGSTDTEQHPSIDKLKSQGWAKRKARAKKVIQEMADQLLRIYAQRKLAQRPAFSEPGDDYYQFEADFTHMETADQQKAIDEVNADLSSEQPMDRLVCGDVGFGKTEVALRAAMRVVMDGFQVVVLAPTTLLSFQHWETFKARFKRYGVEVGLVNRFVKGEDVRNNLAAFSAGRIDILVGTHRLLSKDVIPKHLGLLVVDEEQRFGVGHKEAMKKLKSSCDILTLTATPIPRSLHMALLGIRDISVIATPPTERLAIKTIVAQFDEALIKKAILQEVQRGGQVFFVHNRVHDILEVRAFLQQLVPEVSIAIAHGQMKENNVESIIIDFIQQKFAVLLCTTIIESGIDMPNVNTIIISQADKFGLAQLYQMRGRVGRSNRQSYAYFLTHGTLGERDEARQRLEILAAHQELGVGFQIASYDMELRGTGNLLGGEQSGQMADIGYELYLDLLDKEIATIRGEEKESELEPEIKIPVSASLPESYISKEKQRLAIYKSLFSAAHLEDVERLAHEMRDRFGAPPEETISLFSIAALKVVLKKMRVAQLQQLRQGFYELRFAQLKETQIQQISEACQRRQELLHLTADFRLIVQTSPQASMSQQLKLVLEILLPLTL